MCFLTEIIVCVAYLRQKSRVNFRSTKANAGKLKRKYLNRPRPTLAVNVLIKRDTYITISFVIIAELILYDNKYLAKFLKKEHLENEIKSRITFVSVQIKE
jgi:hypothetical protein